MGPDWYGPVGWVSSTNQQVTKLIPGQGSQATPPEGGMQEATKRCFSLSLPVSKNI